ncbi:hypothetical protein DY000_02049257 [Brassica cretica]|uniref:RNase H type-1 domain-containing protein n=1 Tax=Brassica cretica TaxID=69181 RepID=A0ABQ7ENZ6_BRACR|nr:hypothetical protein DY000_02049257 [Brassica cretica]
MLGLFCGQIVLCGIEVWSGKAWSVAAEGKLCLGVDGLSVGVRDQKASGGGFVVRDMSE